MKMLLRSHAGILVAASLALTCAQSRAEKVRDLEADVVYGHKDGLALTMDVYRPKGTPSGGAVLFLVSGGWVSRWGPPEQARPLFAPYLEAGHLDFAERHGSSPRYTIPEAVGDVRRAVRFVRSNAARFGVDAERLGVLGMSAGGHLSLMLATTGDEGNPRAQDVVERESSRVASVAALVPPTDLRVAVWESPESLPAYRAFPALDLPMAKAKEHSPVVHASADDAPALVIMGGKDELVPPRHGEWIAAAYEKAGAAHKLIVLPEAGHGLDGAGNREKVVAEVVRWFDRHLGAPSEE